MNRRQKNVPQPERSPVRIVRYICVAYWLLLTTLLLAPLGLLGFRRIPGSSGSMGVHFVIFAMLGGIVAASRFPLRRLFG